jgi:hypothetical protein
VSNGVILALFLFSQLRIWLLVHFFFSPVLHKATIPRPPMMNSKAPSPPFSVIYICCGLPGLFSHRDKCSYVHKELVYRNQSECAFFFFFFFFFFFLSLSFFYCRLNKAVSDLLHRSCAGNLPLILV